MRRGVAPGGYQANSFSLCLENFSACCLTLFFDEGEVRVVNICLYFLSLYWYQVMYVELVEALCAEHQFNLIKVEETRNWGNGGLCKMGREKTPLGAVSWW